MLLAVPSLVSIGSVHHFFGRELPSLDEIKIDPLFVSSSVTSPDLSDHTFRLLQYLDLASRANAGQESAVDDLAKELLRLLQYEERGTLLRSRYAIPLTICGETNRYAQTDVCLVHGTSIILLILQEDKTASSSSRNLEPQVIAGAIAAFQSNNHARAQFGLPELETMIFPCITMIGTRPTFYEIPVSKQLSQAVMTGSYPLQATNVAKCVVVPTTRRLSEGMETPEYRKIALQHFDAFRMLAKECWSVFMVGVE